MTKTLHAGTELNEDQVQSNYDYFIEFLKENFSGERLEKMLVMYDEDNLGLQLATAPASGRIHFHYAHTGGYLQHVMHVEKASRGSEKLYQALGGTIDYYNEERLFAALHHDLGKLGDETGAYYIPNESEWHRVNQGMIFKFNPNSQFWRVTDRSLYNLQRFGIKVTWKETLAIKLSDGMYDDASQSYLKTFDPEKSLKTNLPYIIHAADMFACHAESDEWARSTTGDTGVKI